MLSPEEVAVITLLPPPREAPWYKSRRAAEARLDETNRQARELSHRLSNDLTVALGALELAQAAANVPSDVRGLLAVALASFEHATERVYDFAALATAVRRDES
jgi:hypothetical protein